MWQASGRSAEETARQLGISVFHLYDWRKAQRGPREAPAALPEDKEWLKAEVTRLRGELDRARAEARDQVESTHRHYRRELVPLSQSPVPYRTLRPVRRER